MKIDEYIKTSEEIKNRYNKTLEEVNKIKIQAGKEFTTSNNQLMKKARTQGLFVVKLGDFIDKLCYVHNLKKEDLNIAVDLHVVVDGNAKRTPTIRLFDNNPANAEYKKMAITITSKKNAEFFESFYAPFRLYGYGLADGSKFRDNLNYEKKHNGKKTLTLLTWKPGNEENLMIDFSMAMQNNLSENSKEALFHCIREKEARQKIQKKNSKQKTTTETRSK